MRSSSRRVDDDDSPVAMELDAMLHSQGWAWFAGGVLTEIDMLCRSLETERDIEQVRKFQVEIATLRRVLQKPKEMMNG